jgi:hypothetical protein
VDCGWLGAGRLTGCTVPVADADLLLGFLICASRAESRHGAVTVTLSFGLAVPADAHSPAG